MTKPSLNSKPYLELRKQVVEAVRGGMKVTTAAKRFNVPAATICRWKKIGEIPLTQGRTTRNSPIQKAQKNASENLVIYRDLFSQVSIDNQIEANYLASSWGIDVAINYCRVVLSPNYHVNFNKRERT